MSDKANAVLRDASGEIVAVVPSPEAEAPKAAKRIGSLGDPIAFSCESKATVEGYQPAKSEIMRGDVGTVTFQLVHGIKVTARIERHQKASGEAQLVLALGPKFSRGDSNITADALQSKEWSDDVLTQWKAYRTERKYPTVTLVPKSQLTTAGIAD